MTDEFKLNHNHNLTRRAASLLSLARRAGELISGEDTVIMSLKGKGKALTLVIVAEDAAENTKSKILSAAASAEVDCITAGQREELSQAVGLYNRTVFAVADEGFARSIKAELELAPKRFNQS